MRPMSSWTPGTPTNQDSSEAGLSGPKQNLSNQGLASPFGLLFQSPTNRSSCRCFPPGRKKTTISRSNLQPFIAPIVSQLTKVLIATGEAATTSKQSPHQKTPSQNQSAFNAEAVTSAPTRTTVTTGSYSASCAKGGTKTLNAKSDPAPAFRTNLTSVTSTTSKGTATT